MSRTIFHTDRPTQRGMAGAKLLPMSRDDALFWQLRRQRADDARREGRAQGHQQ